MVSDRDEKIRQRAHQIWEREGWPEGKHDEHWAQAAREIDNEAEAGAAAAGRVSVTTADDPTGPDADQIKRARGSGQAGSGRTGASTATEGAVGASGAGGGQGA